MNQHLLSDLGERAVWRFNQPFGSSRIGRPFRVWKVLSGTGGRRSAGKWSTSSCLLLRGNCKKVHQRLGSRHKTFCRPSATSCTPRSRRGRGGRSWGTQLL
ncbi:unnamed protein product [Discosporangium mesarthrocarpum]